MKQNKKIFSSLFAAIFLFLAVLAFLSTGCGSKTNAKLYFAKYEDNLAYLVPEIRQVANNNDFYKTLIEELVRGPEDAQLYPVIPSVVKVNSVTIEEGLAIIDFSKEILTENQEIPHSSTTETLAIYSIADTLTEFEEITKIRITVEGKQKGIIDGLNIEDFWGHIGIYDDFSRNEQILTKDTMQ